MDSFEMIQVQRKVGENQIVTVWTEILGSETGADVAVFPLNVEINFGSVGEDWRLGTTQVTQLIIVMRDNVNKNTETWPQQLELYDYSS